MRNLLLTVLLCAGTASLSFGQAILTAENMNPYLGDVYINNVCETSGVSEGPSGPHQTWTFSGLLPATSGTLIDTANVKACGLTATCSLFSGADMAIVSSSTIDYIITSSGKLQHKGYYNSPTQFAVYNDPIDQFRFPFTYNTKFVDACDGTIVFTPSGLPTVTATEVSSDTVECDGYGTLILPGGLTYPNVLRVHSYQNFRDSADVFGTPVIETYKLETYTWYTPGYHSPLLTIATATSDLTNYKVVSYSAKKLKTAVENIGNTSVALQLFPNPATDVLNVKFNLAGNEHVRISLIDMLGREAGVIANKDMQGAQSIAYNTAGLAKGMYMVRLQSGTETITRKIELQ
ncbi:MAG: Por secretion system C-terminal sorting domain containing protein [Flavipsychrobacter sp.]|nr:Por secretion system C-terminal sorting domain containing protein [Flavipsychrobacter sp.]